MLARCVRLVTYRVKNGLGAVRMCSCVCVSDRFREKGVKNYRKCECDITGTVALSGKIVTVYELFN
jgi:hypothetical protein